MATRKTPPKVLVKELVAPDTRYFSVDFGVTPSAVTKAFPEQYPDYLGKSKVAVNGDVIFVEASCGQEAVLSKKALLKFVEKLEGK